MARLLVNGGLVSSGLGKQPLFGNFSHSHNDHRRCSPSRGVISATSGQKQEQYYYTLGVSPGSSKQDIKRAYHQLALKYHPDVCKGDHCVPKFKQITTAYEQLKLLIHSVFTQEDEYVTDDYLSDEDEESEFEGGWEGAWFF